MKTLLKGYEALSLVFMFSFLILFMMAASEGSMDAAVILLVTSFLFILTTAWTHSSTYVNWKIKKGYEEL